MKNRREKRCFFSIRDEVNEKSNKRSTNDLPVVTIDPKLSLWIKIIHPSRSSLHIERME